MNGKNIGYIRVSSIDQNTARQLEGVPLDKTMFLLIIRLVTDYKINNWFSII